MPTPRTAAALWRWSYSRLRVPTQPRHRSIHGRRHFGETRKYLKVSEEVQDAVASSRPVVALETTIYTHGFPYPDNVALASRLESIVRQGGAVPATIGVLDGVARVGMTPDELAELASSSQTQKVLKVSRRDLGYICGLGLSGKKMNGGTTIAGTMVLAHTAGIKVFATGGLGGVHRGGQNSMDISADLTELGRTPVALISSGCKSFLDIQRTLEYLETEGVLVGAFADGREGNVDFPAFYTRNSGIRAPKVIHDEAEAAAIIYAQSRLNISSGLVFANPVPEKFSFPKQEIDDIIEQALELSELEGIHGSDNTPFVLAKIRELSGGKSVATNTALVESNVERGTKVAVELAKLETGRPLEGNRHMSGYLATASLSSESPPAQDALKPPSPAIADLERRPDKVEKTNVLVAGSLAIDFACDYTPASQKGDGIPALHTSNPSIIRQNLGGVGHNVALAANYVGSSVLLCSVVADDFSGRAALAALENSQPNLHSQGIQVLSPATGCRTAQYVSVNDAKNNLMLAMADMTIMEAPQQSLAFNAFWDPLVQRARPNWVVIDANWNPDVISKWISLAKSHGAKIAFEPVSDAKSTRLFTRSVSNLKSIIQPSFTIPNHTIDIVTPNRHELTTMYTTARESGLFESAQWWEVINSLEMPSSGSRDRLVSITNSKLVDQGIPQQAIQLLPFIPCIISKLGPQGVLLTQILPPSDARLRSADYARYILGRSYADGNNSPIGGVYMRLFPPAEVLKDADVVSVNGAGDTLLGVIVAGLAQGEGSDDVGLRRLDDIISVAQRASVETLKSADAVSAEISKLVGTLQCI
ncbi:serine/threonine protein kinase [Blastomyces dermatitidis ATCC 18188]|uniref:Serine/threonine protein kinase n=1 Tax=Ajellomyces dermatitidis (strain ATCC 18188 / CBS 674.68) TaxID=653446 RepID=F2T462_AJEDA|nr:serine/threonine protein kinase [Blastomyces dermatitidis ATCC 18188]